MSIITFWSNGREQTGKTLSIAAITTHMAIEHNYKILVISTAYKDSTLDRCFWEEKKVKRNLGLFGPNTNIALEEGIVGLNKIMNSNKLSPENITNYTKIIFKDRLEILPSFKGDITEYKELVKSYPDIINLANNYYDLVFVDLDMNMDNAVADIILKNSNLVIANLSQRLTSINSFIQIREEVPILNSKKSLILIGIYLDISSLFFEACEEAKVPDLFLRLRKVDEEDRNNFFISEVKRVSENIIYRLQDLQMKM